MIDGDKPLTRRTRRQRSHDVADRRKSKADDTSASPLNTSPRADEDEMDVDHSAIPFSFSKAEQIIANPASLAHTKRDIIVVARRFPEKEERERKRGQVVQLRVYAAPVMADSIRGEPDHKVEVGPSLHHEVESSSSMWPPPPPPAPSPLSHQPGTENQARPSQTCSRATLDPRLRPR